MQIRLVSTNSLTSRLRSGKRGNHASFLTATGTSSDGIADGIAVQEGEMRVMRNAAKLMQAKDCRPSRIGHSLSILTGKTVSASALTDVHGVRRNGL